MSPAHTLFGVPRLKAGPAYSARRPDRTCVRATMGELVAAAPFCDDTVIVTGSGDAISIARLSGGRQTDRAVPGHSAGRALQVALAIAITEKVRPQRDARIVGSGSS